MNKIGRIILNPDEKTLASYGILAHVDETERKRILDAPAGWYSHEVTSVEKELAKILKKQKKTNKLHEMKRL